MITQAHAWPGQADARRDYVATDDGAQVGRIYQVDIATGRAWLWAANGIPATPGTVGCALSGREPTKQAAADRVKSAWAMWLKTNQAPPAGADEAYLRNSFLLKPD